MTRLTVIVAVAMSAATLFLVWSVARARVRSGAVTRRPSARHEAAVPARPASLGANHLGGLYQSVFQSLADALIVIDEKGLIQSFSPSAERTFGYSGGEVVGRSVSILIPPHEREQHETQLRQYVESGWASQRVEQLVLTGDARIIRPERETTAVRKDGTLFPARLIVSEVEAEGARLFVGLISDVSERKRLERELAAQVDAQTTLLDELRKAYAVIELQKSRMQNELDIGRDIQLSMVPHRFPRLERVDVWATLRPAREVGGDFYDVLATPDGGLWLCVGDVAGKGVPSALLMASTKTLLASWIAQGLSPGEVLSRVNAEISRDNERGMFITAFLGRLDPNTYEFRYSNAGHNPPLLQRAGAIERLSTRHGPVLGGTESVRYCESTVQLTAGDLLLLFTDGVTEALDAEDRLFSEARLQEAIKGRFASAEEAVKYVVAKVEAFAGKEQADDITVMALRLAGSDVPIDERRFTVRIPNSLEAIGSSIGSVASLVARCGGDETVQRRFAVAIDELVSNVIRYGYQKDPDGVIECEVVLSDGTIAAVISDDGAAFNPLDWPEPDTTLGLDQREPRGLGVHIVRRLFHDMRYERCGDRNITTLTYRL